MSVVSILNDLESRLSTAFGQATTLSDLQNNSADPLVQIGLHYAGALNTLEEQLGSQSDSLNPKNSDCDALEAAAGFLGITRQVSGSKSSSIIVFTGTNGTTIPSGTTFIDYLENNWVTSEEVKITNGFASVTATSPVGSFTTTDNGLSIVTAIDGVSAYTNLANSETGFTSETCEEFRQRILSPAQPVDTNIDLLTKLSVVSDSAKVITDLPACLGEGVALVVNGGNNLDIAAAIRTLSKFNYARLKGDTTVTEGCETVRFIRPCPVGVSFNYYSKEDIPDLDFINALCANQDLSVKGILNSIECLGGFEMKLTYSRNENQTCDEDVPTSGIACDSNTISLVNDSCYCNSDCLETDYKACHNLQEWEYPVFVAATRVSDTC